MLNASVATMTDMDKMVSHSTSRLITWRAIPEGKRVDMSVMNVVEQYVMQTYPGILTIGPSVSLLIHMGCTSYSADFRLKRMVYHFSDGATYQTPLKLPLMATLKTQAIPAKLSRIIQTAQTGDIYYSQFLRAVLRAGCVGYAVWLLTGIVNLFGSGGEVVICTF